MLFLKRTAQIFENSNNVTLFANGPADRNSITLFLFWFFGDFKTNPAKVAVFLRRFSRSLSPILEPISWSLSVGILRNPLLCEESSQCQRIILTSSRRCRRQAAMPISIMSEFLLSAFLDVSLTFYLSLIYSQSIVSSFDLSRFILLIILFSVGFSLVFGVSVMLQTRVYFFPVYLWCSTVFIIIVVVWDICTKWKPTIWTIWLLSNRFHVLRKIERKYFHLFRVFLRHSELIFVFFRFLRQLRHNRNVERDLMKNVEGWEVGTLWGKPVYQNTPENQIPPIHLHEFYAHRAYKEIKAHSRPNNEVGLEDCDRQTGH